MGAHKRLFRMEMCARCVVVAFAPCCVSQPMSHILKGPNFLKKRCANPVVSYFGENEALPHLFVRLSLSTCGKISDLMSAAQFARLL